MATNVKKTDLFHQEVALQWRSATAAKRAAEAADDRWMVEAMTGRLEDLRDLLRLHASGPVAALCA